MKKWLCACLALIVCLCGCAALAEDAPAEDAAITSVTLQFEEGFCLSVPANWVRYAVSEEDAAAGVLYALGDGSGSRFVYIHSQDAKVDDVDALNAAYDARPDCDRTSVLDLNGQPFVTYIAQELNVSGCATLLDGKVITFLFTPQNDDGFMLKLAEIMQSFELAE